jgi:sigma-E factor negative regulatory protein RseC
MEEIGVIKSVDGAVAKVSVPKRSACEGCTVGICKPDEQSMEIEALNPLKAQAGQKVRVVMKPYTYLKGSLIVYGLPTLALIIGAVIGKELFSHYFKGIDADIISAISGFGLFVLSFIAIKLWSSRMEKRTDIRPIIEEIIE